MFSHWNVPVNIAVFCWVWSKLCRFQDICSQPMGNLCMYLPGALADTFSVFLVYISVRISDSFYNWTGYAENLPHGTHPSTNACVRYFFFLPQRSASCTCNFLLLTKMLLLTEKDQDKEIQCLSLPLTAPPCGASSAFGVIKQVEARLMPLHRGKLQRRAEGWFGGAPEESKGPSLLWLGWHVSPHPSQGGCLFSHAVHWLHPADWRRMALFLPFSGKDLSRGTQDWQLLFTEVLTVTSPCRGHGRKGHKLFLPVFSTPLGKSTSQSASWHLTLWFIHSEFKLSNAFDWTNPEVHPLISVTVPLLPSE